MTRGIATVLLLWCAAAGAAERPKTVPAWRNCVDRAAAEEAMCAYTSNVIRCYWAGEDPKVAGLMPANLSFQFAVAGDSDVTNRVQKVLEDVADSLRPEVRRELESHGLLNPALQWIVRWARPAVVKADDFVNPRNHPAVFRESDFDAERLKPFAARLSVDDIPLPVKVTFRYPSQMSPLGKAEPVVDYPDILPEETFTLPFGVAIVPRALERRRKIRLSAVTWPVEKPVEFVWRGCWALPWVHNGYQTPKAGFADVVYGVAGCRPRMDIMVWAKFGDGRYGPPTVVSIYSVPYCQRKYGKKGIESISYVKTARNVPYDISQIWIPRQWKDVFELNSSGQVFAFERIVPGRIRGDRFSAIGELIHETSSSGFPLKTSRVEYFVSPETGDLRYRETGDEVTYRLGESPYRRSGE